MPSILVVTDHCSESAPLPPIGVALACTDHPESIHNAVRRFVGPVAVVPLMLTANSWSYRVVATAAEAWPDARLAPPVGESPVVAEIVADRAGELSGDPSHEALVLVAAGEAEHSDDLDTLRALEQLALEVKGRVPFGLMKIATLRIGASETEQTRALSRLREMIVRESRRFRVLALPMEFVSGRIERTLPRLLADLPCEIVPRPLLPHPALDQFLRETAEALTAESSSC